MEIPAPFRACGDHIGIRLGPAHAVFTTRLGGHSSAAYASLNLGLLTDDAPEAVNANREALARAFGVSFLYGKQVHGAQVATSDRPTEPGAALDADGQATNATRIAAMVLTADCLPIALAGSRGVAMLHAGWRGLACGVIANGVSALRALGDDGPLEAAIGPGAGVCCYEVGEEVHAALGPLSGARRGANADLKLIATTQLTSAGVEQVHDLRMCTICSDPRYFFSHRRDGGKTGRQGGIAWLS